MKEKENSLKERLNHLLSEAKGQPVSMRLITDTLAGKGQAALLILLVLPFCQPIQIPGFSTPFGIVLIFIGLRVAFGHHTWIPKKLLDKEISFKTLEKISDIAIKITNKLSFLTSTRLVYLVNKPALHIAHGLAIALMAFFLSLPLPIPFTNLLSAYPILFFGLGLLEDDGVMILLAYFFLFLCLLMFTFLFLFGKGFYQSYFPF